MVTPTYLYEGERPGCYKCRKPIEPKHDYYSLIWRGKTWCWEVNYHIDCLTQAIEDGDFQRARHLEEGSAEIMKESGA